MNDSNPLPDSISHKKLNSLLISSQKEQLHSNSSKYFFQEEKDAFQQRLMKWSTLSQELLIELNKKNEYIIEGRSPKSLMALGAFEAHLNMAINAHKASDIEK